MTDALRQVMEMDGPFASVEDLKAHLKQTGLLPDMKPDTLDRTFRRLSGKLSEPAA